MSSIFLVGGVGFHPPWMILLQVSLAHVPLAGKRLTAPVPTAPQGMVIKPRTVNRRTSNELQAAAAENPVQVEPSRRSSSRRGGRAVRPNTGLSESHQEKVEVAAIVKMLIAGLLVLGVVLVVAYLLNSQFQRS
ncbi:hypothetical protein N8218_00485 [bacterium]|nr:hypothetical protein [bacterium]